MNHYKYHQIDPTLLTPEEKNGATRLSDERFNTNSISGQNYNDYINSEVGKKQVQQNTQLAYTPSFGAQVKQNIDKFFTPDIRVKVIGDNSIIATCEALTENGADYLLHNSIIDKSYDDVLNNSQLWFEVL